VLLAAVAPVELSAQCGVRQERMAETARRCEAAGAYDTSAHTPASAGAGLRPRGSRPEL